MYAAAARGIGMRLRASRMGEAARPLGGRGGGHFKASLWLQHFRMSMPTFETLCNAIGPFIGPKPSPGRRPIPTDIFRGYPNT